MYYDRLKARVRKITAAQQRRQEAQVLLDNVAVTD